MFYLTGSLLMLMMFASLIAIAVVLPSWNGTLHFIGGLSSLLTWFVLNAVHTDYAFFLMFMIGLITLACLIGDVIITCSHDDNDDNNASHDDYMNDSYHEDKTDYSDVIMNTNFRKD